MRIPEDSLRETATAVFEKMGLSNEDAAEGAHVLVMTDLRGVETHGVSNMLRTYVNQYGDGTLKPESTEGRPWGQPLKKPAGAPLNLG